MHIKIYNNLSLSYERLYEGGVNAVDLIGIASKELSDIASFDKTIGEYLTEMETISTYLASSVAKLKDLLEGVYDD